MEIKKLDIAQKFYSEIKELDKQIIEIDKIARLTVNGNNKLNLIYSCEDFTGKEKINVLDSDNSLINPGNPSIYFSSIFDHKPIFLAPNPNICKLNYEMSESLGLEILAVLIRQKQERRKVLLASLQNLGFKL